MKRFVLLLFCLLLIGFPVAAVEETPGPVARVDDINYSYGYRLGRELSTADLLLRPEALFQALYAALDKAEPELSREEMTGFLETLHVNSSVSTMEQSTLIADGVDAANYSFGFALGERMLQRQIEFHADALSDGIYDGISQKQPRLNEELMAQLLEPAKKKGSAVDEPPKNFRLPGQKYISENSSRDGVISLASGLQYRIIKVGKGKKTPKVVDTVLVLYRATSIEGTEFSSTFPLGIPTPEEVPVNKGLAGWREALLLMHEGDQWELTIPARLAYRDVGPMSGQTVIIDLELLEIFSGY